MDKEKNFWLGTNGGLNKFNPQTNQFTRYQYNENIKSSLSNDTILSMWVDHNDGLWIGTQNGLNKLDKQTGRFTHFILQNRNSINISKQILCIREDQGNELWIGTDVGLYRVNISNGIVTNVLSSAYTTSICVSSKSEIWIGADTARVNGETSLYRLDRIRNQFVSFADPNSQKKIRGVFDIMEDNKLNLWVSTTDAILRINSKRDRLRKYGSGYGVHINGFGTGDNFKAGNGKLFFGDLYGYYSFFPDDLKDSSRTILNFTSFKLNGKEIIPAAGGILNKAVWRTDEIRLAFNENSFSFEFSGINYQNIGELQYQFKLEKL